MNVTKDSNNEKAIRKAEKTRRAEEKQARRSDKKEGRQKKHKRRKQHSRSRRGFQCERSGDSVSPKVTTFDLFTIGNADAMGRADNRG